MTYQQERMPEHIKLKVGGASSQQSAVYEEFARNVPGFKPLTERELLSILPMAPPQTPNNTPAVMSSAAPGAPGTGAPPGSTAAGTATSQPQPQQPNQPPTAQLVTSEECVAILDEVYSKVEPFVTQCNLLYLFT